MKRKVGAPLIAVVVGAALISADGLLAQGRDAPPANDDVEGFHALDFWD